jgi:hypothetical protein
VRGKFEKWYTKKEFLETYSQYKMTELKKTTSRDTKAGKYWENELWAGIFEKP